MTEVFARQALLQDGWEEDVAIAIGDSGQIETVTPGSAPAGPVHDIVLPAPQNLHSHAFQRAMAGLTEARGDDPSDSFWTWRRLMYRFLDQLTPEDVQAIAALTFMEMLEAGYSSVAEFHYLHHAPHGRHYDQVSEMGARIIAAAQTTGIGLTHLPVFYSYGGCDQRALKGGQQRFGNDFDTYLRLYDESRAQIAAASADYRIGVAPHSLRAVSRDDLAAVAQVSTDGPVHLHIAEQVAEVAEVKDHFGARPVEWLLENAEVDERWCLIHLTQMTEAETMGVAATGAVAGLCPITEASLGDGIFNGTDFLTAGGRFGVGSDSNIHVSLFGELCALEYSQRLRDKSRAALATRDRSTGRVLFEGAAKGGARAGGRKSGAIAIGNWADLVGISTDNPWVCGRGGDTALDSLIFSGHGHACIRDVWSAGRHVVHAGRHIERDRIVQEFLSTVRDLGARI